MPRLLTKIELLVELPPRAGDEIKIEEIEEQVSQIDSLLFENGYVLADVNMYQEVNI